MKRVLVAIFVFLMIPIILVTQLIGLLFATIRFGLNVCEISFDRLLDWTKELVHNQMKNYENL